MEEVEVGDKDMPGLVGLTGRGREKSSELPEGNMFNLPPLLGSSTNNKPSDLGGTAWELLVVSNFWDVAPSVVVIGMA